MAGGPLNGCQKQSFEGLDGIGMVMGLGFSAKSGLDLMQNCDLPPPLKVFAGPRKTVLSSMNGIRGTVVEEDEHEELRSGSEKEKLELLKALRLSQTRAREAEEKAAVLGRERDCLSNALLEESMRLLAYRRWVKVLELQSLKLAKQGQVCSGCNGSRTEDETKDAPCMKWLVAVALYLGITGVGFAFGCKYLF